MSLNTSDASIVCDPERSRSGTLFCTAAIAIEKNLIAVWNVWNDERESPEEMAQRQGKAIAAFVLNALGPVENFPELVRLSCGLQRPGTEPIPGRVDLCA